MKLLLWLRLIFCRHECRIGDIRRLDEDHVACRCRCCGKLLSAPFGLALPAKLVR